MGLTEFFGAVFNLDHVGKYIHWGFIQLSVSNAILIALMIVTFISALLLPFPGKRNRKEGK